MSFCVARVALCDTPQFTLYTPHSTLYTPHFTLHTPHFTLHTLHSTFYTPHFTLHTPHSRSTVDFACPYIRLHYVICIRVRWFLLFFPQSFQKPISNLPDDQSHCRNVLATELLGDFGWAALWGGHRIHWSSLGRYGPGRCRRQGMDLES